MLTAQKYTMRECYSKKTIQKISGWTHQTFNNVKKKHSPHNRQLTNLPNPTTIKLSLKKLKTKKSWLKIQQKVNTILNHTLTNSRWQFLSPHPCHPARKRSKNGKYPLQFLKILELGHQDFLDSLNIHTEKDNRRVALWQDLPQLYGNWILTSPTIYKILK